MITLEATVPCGAPPAWAVWERRLFDLLDQAVWPYWEKYTRPDGSLIWREAGHDNWQTRDGVDDFYEAFYNWPLLYLLGGGEHLLRLSHQAWEGITAQLTNLGMLKHEFDIGYDQFHISEGQNFFNFLAMADPTNQKIIERARRFAGFYLNEDPEALNYDPILHLLRAPHTGSGGPRWGYLENDPPALPWSEGMQRYGLPYNDVPGVTTYDDLHDPHHAQAMGAVMQLRMGRGDVATNLLATTLITNAALLTGDEKYQHWVETYVKTWMQRAQANGGLLPDNVGLSGQIGEYINGKWYGGLYGWTWPHGFYNLGAAAFVASANAFVLTAQPQYFDLPRSQLAAITALGELRHFDETEMSLRHHWSSLDASLSPPRLTWMVPYRYGDNGWFDYQPVDPGYLIRLWALSMDHADEEQILHLRHQSHYDWQQVVPIRTKEDGGHETAWYSYLKGENPNYPEAIFTQSFQVVNWRLAEIEHDQADLTQVNIHHWQQLNPVTPEALVQLTLGAPQHNYYGGLLHSRLRYFDADAHRPGLPQDIAALVERLEPENALVHLVNLSPRTSHNVIIQAGGFGEHLFTGVRFTMAASGYPGPFDEVTRIPSAELAWHEVKVTDRSLEIHLPPLTQITLDLGMRLHVSPPSYQFPAGKGADRSQCSQVRRTDA